MKRNRRTSIVLIVAAALAAASPALADRLVSTLGDDAANDCSVLPCRTIAKAVAVAGDGETIEIARGSYLENVDLAGIRTLTMKGGYGENFDEATRDPLAKKGTILSGGKTDRFLRVRAGSGESITLTIDGVVITKSVGTSNAGDLFQPGGGVTVDASAGGAALLTLRQVRFTKNKAATGGAVAIAAIGANSFAAASIVDCRFEQNEAINLGGGAFRTHTLSGGSVDVEVVNTVFIANKASDSGDGGAVLADVSSGSGAHQHAYGNATFQRNSAGGSGGALAGFIFPGSLSIALQNSVLLDNRASRDGGAVDVSSLSNDPNSASDGRVDLRNDTILGNRAKGLGGGMHLTTRLDGSPTIDSLLLNSIVFKNRSGGGGDDIVLDEQVGAITAQLTTSDVGELLTFDTDVTETGTLSVDPRVAKKTGLLAADSPMIDAGTCDGAPKTDIEDQPRPNPVGPDPVKCDIGADEF